ncbi:hypothetical protein [Streptomyces iranensis]|uniref:Uncharacterized protein n=1 Tax=Streptomyces iranensis TaxID=576784 RepID=A0A060ZZ72_9ACTN|nr:hypothetical protein [Streptomyces iranensis]MBP2066193.1 hypothetical protein [Streptomyces iranensis]CDR13066.1 predicted protein [Streptomyces iranensis]
MTTSETPLSALDSLDKTEIRWLFGPEDRMPADYRGPHRLSHRGWLNFAERLERGEEISAILAALSGSRQVLDGLSRLAVWRTEAALHFPESVLEERVVAAAGVLVDFWYEGHARAADMKEAPRPVLYRHFDQRPHAIGDQGVVLIARPAVRS